MTDTTTHFHCCQCHQDKSYTGIGTGYGKDKNGRVICYACCGNTDRAHMIETGKAVLYLTTKAEAPSYGSATISNWPGSLEFKGRYSVGKHNIARKRYDVKFFGPDGFVWVGTQYGDNTQICHCKRTKSRKW